MGMCEACIMRQSQEPIHGQLAATTYWWGARDSSSIQTCRQWHSKISKTYSNTENEWSLWWGNGRNVCMVSLQIINHLSNFTHEIKWSLWWVMQQTFWISSRISSLLSSMQDWKMCRSISCRMGLIHIVQLWRTKNIKQCCGQKAACVVMNINMASCFICIVKSCVYEHWQV